MPEILSSAAAAAAVKKVAETAANDIYVGTTSAARKALDKLLVQFGVGFSTYIERTYSRCRFVKTILHRIDPIPIERAYIQPTLQIRNNVVTGSKLVEELDRLKNIVVTGTGGSGKSMFLKHTFLELCSNTFGRIPLFVELRELNDASSLSLTDLIFNQWSSLLPGFTVEQLDYALRKGKFTLLLDAVDEIDVEHRDKYCREIIDFSVKYSQCRLLVTSRPDDRFQHGVSFISQISSRSRKTSYRAYSESRI